MLSSRNTAQLAASGLALIAVAYGFARFAYGLFVPSFRAEFDLDPSQVGLIGSASYAAYCVAIYPSMMLTPRVGSRAMAVIVGLFAAAGTALIGFAIHPSMLAFGVILAGISTGIVSPALAHAVARGVSSGRQSRVQAIVNSGTGLGVALSGPIALVTVEQWRSAWIAFALCAVAATLWAGRSVPAAAEPATHRGNTTQRVRLRAVLPEPLLPPGACRLLATSTALGVCTAAVWVFGQDMLTGPGGQSDVTATAAWALLGICGLAGAAAGDVAHRMGLPGAWVAVTVALSISTALLGIVPDDVLSGLAASAVFGAAYICATGLLLIAGASTYHQQPAAGVGLAFLALALGQTIGGGLIGMLMDLIGPTVAFLLAAAAAAGSALVPPVEGSGLRHRHRLRITATHRPVAQGSQATQQQD